MENNQIQRVQNPFSVQKADKPEGGVMEAVASSGEIARVQVQMMSARMYPRNEQAAVDRMLNAFQRPTLAGKAVYQYARGGSDVSGLSIRSAETMANAWGNCDFGWRELEQKPGESKLEAYCWDLETNVRRSMVFAVPHFRDTRAGRKRLEDARDIYELCANQAARRVRACILAIIPSDIQEAVQQQVENTLTAQFTITADTLKGWLEAFGKIGVTKEMLEARIQRRWDTLTPAQLMGLNNIFNSIRDGIGRVSDFFEVPQQAAQQAPQTLADKARQAQQQKAQDKPQEAAKAVTGGV